MTLRTFWTHDPKKNFGGGRESNRSPWHMPIGAYYTIFIFSTKPNTFSKQIKFQTVDRHNAGQPIGHALTHGARTTARRRVKEWAVRGGGVASGEYSHVDGWSRIPRQESKKGIRGGGGSVPPPLYPKPKNVTQV